MPKLRLSALVTDMKGKSGGSVFSTNSGGTYFRNNPSGGGRSSSAWDKSKATLSTLAGQWRNLTAEQQTAWNDAVDNYPAVNAFGEPRTPSGYELFMRLNGTLINLGLALQTTPSLPRALPNYGAVSLSSPDNFLFTPQFGFSNLPTSNSKECTTGNPCPEGQICVVGSCWENDTAILSLNELAGLNTTEDYTFSAIVKIGKDTTVHLDEMKSWSIFNIDGGVSGGAKLTIIEDPEGIYTIGYSLSTGEAFYGCGFEFPEEYFDKFIRLSFFFDASNPATAVIAVNGVPLVLDSSDSSGELVNIADSPVYFGFTPNMDLCDLIIQDIRFYNGGLTSEQNDLMVKGYLLGNEVILFDTYLLHNLDGTECKKHSDCPDDKECFRGTCLPFNPDGTLTVDFINYGSSGSSVVLEARVFPSFSQTMAPVPRMFSPILDIETEFQGEANDYFVVEASAPMSDGKGSGSVQYKRIGVYDANGVNTFEVGEDYINKFGFISYDSSVNFRISSILTDTGQKSTPAKKPKKRRFKAGQDLSTHINP